MKSRCMYQKDPKVDEYILKAADFARPVLAHLRKLVIKACPKVQESIKWSFPNFTYKGSILCSMAAFKQHCSFGFWLAAIMEDPHHVLQSNEKNAMGDFGQIKSMNHLPGDHIILEYISQAMWLIDKGAKLPRKENVKEVVEPHPSFINALKGTKTVETNFNNFSSSQKREYIEWINDAKTEATRNKRIADAIHWIQEGKNRNWKYEKC